MIKEINYEIIKIKPKDENHIKTLYKWNSLEDRKDYFTCRPLKEVKPYDEYAKDIKNMISGDVAIFILKKELESDALGKITLFDYNPRNRSAEIGYYFPKENRKKGLGKIMITLFLSEVFDDEKLNLHKLYATTAEGNKESIKLLKYSKFNLDGRIREHYWIEDTIQDQLHYSLLRKEFKKY